MSNPVIIPDIVSLMKGAQSKLPEQHPAAQLWEFRYNGNIYTQQSPGGEFSVTPGMALCNDDVPDSDDYDYNYLAELSLSDIIPATEEERIIIDRYNDIVVPYNAIVHARRARVTDYGFKIYQLQSLMLSYRRITNGDGDNCDKFSTFPVICVINRAIKSVVDATAINFTFEEFLPSRDGKNYLRFFW